MDEVSLERMLRVVSVIKNGKNDNSDEEGYEALQEVQSSSVAFLLQQAIHSLEAAESFADIKAIHDKAIGIHEFAKLRKDGFGLQQAAAALRIRAEHKAGCALSEIEREPGKRTDHGEKTKYQEILEAEGISIGVALRWQQVSLIPLGVLTDFLAKTIVAEREITTAEVLRLLPEPHARQKPGQRDKVPMKNRKVLLTDSTELTIQEQDDIIWEAIARAHFVAKKENMREEVKALGHYPGYWLAHICAEYNAHNQLEEE